jgi:predicted permease
MTTLDAATRIIPVLLLFVTGFVLKATKFVAASTMTDVKKLVVNITLPALMFTAFLSLEPGPGELAVAGGGFALCIVLLIASRLVDRGMNGRWGIRSYMMGGFEAGMLGYALFLSVFGNDALPVFASVDLGQVVFVFVILMPMLQARRAGESGGGPGREGAAGEPGGAGKQSAGAAVALLRRVVTSPIIWAIAGGLIVGAIGRATSIPAEPFGPISQFLDTIGGLTAPLIALVIGYELEFHPEVLGKALVFVLIRKVVLVGAALLALWLIPGIPALTRFAILTMLLLPPPYVVTLAAHDDEQGLTAGVLSISTVISVLAFAAVVFITGGTI